LRSDTVAQGRRRDAILSAAREEFARYGFAGARIERIVGAAGVNKQLAFHYFHSKEGLYAAATSATFATWQPVPDTDGASPAERLRHVATSLVQWLSDNPGAAVAIADAGRAQAPDANATPPAPDAAVWLVNARNSVRSAVESGQRQGYFRDDVDPVAVAEIIAGCAVGHAITTGSSDGDARPEVAARLASCLAQVMAEYCAWR
jgi:TetR/AcrR family transcriptional regulator